MLIVGETGVGKEFVAQAVHVLSGRRGAFQAVNCAALPVALAEAELFGHSRGAFTGAEQAALGHLRAADGGTLFLDELPELPLPVQAKLLRVLQDGRVTPLGDTRRAARELQDRRGVPAGARASDRERAAPPRSGRAAVRIDDRGAAAAQRRVDVAFFFRSFLSRHAAEPAPGVDPRMLECCCCMTGRETCASWSC